MRRWCGLRANAFNASLLGQFTYQRCDVVACNKRGQLLRAALAVDQYQQAPWNRAESQGTGLNFLLTNRGFDKHSVIDIEFWIGHGGILIQF
jgi:hypothetical protein